MGLMVIVEGLMGAGKSTFCTELGAALGPNTLVLLEPDEQKQANPYLEDFYGDKARWSFAMQVQMISMRYRMQQQAQWHAMNDHGHVILDRSFFGDTCFARLMHNQGLMSDKEFETYRLLYQTLSVTVLLPTVCMRLRVDPAVAARRIQGRAAEREGRRSELIVDTDYLVALDKEIDVTVNMLRTQGVHVMEVPWGQSKSSPELRQQDIQLWAATLRCMDGDVAMLPHHRRVLV